MYCAFKLICAHFEFKVTVNATHCKEKMDFSLFKSSASYAVLSLSQNVEALKFKLYSSASSIALISCSMFCSFGSDVLSMQMPCAPLSMMGIMSVCKILP